MKRFCVVFLVVFSMLAAVLFLPISAQASSMYVCGKIWVEPGQIVDGDCFSLDPACGNRVTQLCDNCSTTYLFFTVTQRSYLEFPWGATVWTGTCEQQVEESIRNRSPGWTRDMTTTSWPTGSGYQSTPISTSAYYQTPIVYGDWLVIYSTAYFTQNSCGNASQITPSYPYTVIQILQSGTVYTANTGSLLFRGTTNSQIRSQYPNGFYTTWP